MVPVVPVVPVVLWALGGSFGVAAISLRLAEQLVPARLPQLLCFQRRCRSSSSAYGGACVAPNNCVRFSVVFSFSF